MSCVPLFDAAPDLSRAPLGRIDYGSIGFMKTELTPELYYLVVLMAVGFDRYAVTYQCEYMRPGDVFGHGRWHCDSRADPADRHRLLSFGGPPTEGEDRVLTPGTVWEYTGDYRHRALPTAEPCHRLLIRVSQTNMPHRDWWRLH